MKQQKTSEEWQTLLQLRQSFQGTNIEFYKMHNLSLKTYHLNADARDLFSYINSLIFYVECN